MTDASYYRKRTKQVLSCKSCHTFWLLTHCFWCNLPLTILSEYPLDSRVLLCILLYPFYHLIVAFSLIFHYFAFFSLIITITFSLIALFHLLLTHAFSLVFSDFTLFKFYFCSSTSSILFLWFSFVFRVFISFVDFLVAFYLLMLFLWTFCWWWLLPFFPGNFCLHLCSMIAIFFYNVISA